MFANRIVTGVLATTMCVCSLQSLLAQENGQQSQQLKQVVVEAFAATHDGFSSDEVILQSNLNKSFVAACKKRLPEVDAERFNWTLLNLRKAGQLPARTSRRDHRSYDAVTPIAEMCARMMEDKHSKSIDRLMAKPQTQTEFNEAALAIDANVDTYLVRKAAFTLRKIRQLKPELITRIADWGRQVDEYKAGDLEKQPELVPDSPGIYIFRDSSGYLYIGEARNLRNRLRQHLSNSDSKSLSNYLTDQGYDDVMIEIHSFAADSRIKEIMVRRAYESELIRSRNPKFNVRP